MSLKFNKFDRIKIVDQKTIKDEAKRIVSEFSLKSNISVEFSGKLTKAAGNVTAKPKDDFIIKLSVPYYKEFGVERSLKTLRHEFAHILDFIKTGKFGHGYSFKVLCEKLGGSMCRKHAGTTFSASASDQYLTPKRSVQYVYSCPTCGWSTKRTKRMSEKIRTSLRHACPKCRTKVAYFSEDKLMK